MTASQIFIGAPMANLTIQDRIVAAAKEFEAALNILPNQIAVEVEKIDCSNIDGTDCRFAVRVISTHPVQIYP